MNQPEHFGPSNVITDKTDLSSIDPVAIAYKSLMHAWDLLNELGIKQDGDPSSPQSQVYHRLEDVLDQLIGWDCAQPYRLIGNPLNNVAKYRSDLWEEEKEMRPGAIQEGAPPPPAI